MSDNEKVQIVQVKESHLGQRLDNFLIRHLKGLPRTRVYRLIRRGEVRVNKKRCKPDYRLASGDQIRIPPLRLAPDGPAGKLGEGLKALLLARVLLENEELLVINKPAGMAVHGGSGIRLGLIDALRQIKPEWAQLELCHRLDRDTSGCLVIAKNTRFLKHLQGELKARSIKKQYLALVHGQWPEALGEVTAPLKRDSLNGAERIVRVNPEGKPARTAFRVLQRFSGATLIEAEPETGRTHQIRVHCQHAGHPIVGDSKYTARRPAAALAGVKFLCLHAAAIEFTEAPGGAVRRVVAPLDKQLQNLLERLEQT